MNNSRRTLIKLSSFATIALVMGSCGDIENILDDDKRFEVSLEASGASIDHYEDKVVLIFNQAVDPSTLSGNIYLSDKTGSLEYMHNTLLDNEDKSQKRVILQLHEEYSLLESWKYTVVITNHVHSTEGTALKETQLEFVTTAKSPFDSSKSDDAIRNKVVIVSDLHLSKQSENDNNYMLFTENSTRLREFLEDVRSSQQIKELVILGDFMDIWIVPMEYETFDASVADSMAFFQAIADANQEIIDKLNQIADEGNIIFSYVPGNHDMHLDETIFHTIFPNALWKGTAQGTGIYYLEDDIALEHGHNYDVFNAPDPFSNPGSILPPGYFITRIYTTQNAQRHSKIQEAYAKRSIETDAYIYGWNLAIETITSSDFDTNKAQITTGIDNYTKTYSSNEARDIYTDNIVSDWSKRQRQNGVYQPEPFVISTMTGSGKFWSIGSLKVSAISQYFIPRRAKIVVFGHTHQAMITKDIWTLYNIYANSGTWVDKEYLEDGQTNCTCVVLNSSKSTKSDIDTVTLYRYTEDYILRKLSEESLDNSFFEYNFSDYM
ncbi:MAG: metallophosphoesterase [Campylobacterota bacterium]|nr:metallophosphoesterase [Campylobacterota bacterium]